MTLFDTVTAWPRLNIVPWLPRGWRITRLCANTRLFQIHENTTITRNLDLSSEPCLPATSHLLLLSTDTETTDESFPLRLPSDALNCSESRHILSITAQLNPRHSAGPCFRSGVYLGNPIESFLIHAHHV